MESFKSFYLVEGPEEKARKLANKIGISDLDPDVLRYIDLDTRRILKAEDKDIGKIKTAAQLRDIIQKYGEAESKREVERKIKTTVSQFASDPFKDEAELILENDKVMIVHPKTFNASKHFGISSWCTSVNRREYEEKTAYAALNYIVPLNVPYPNPVEKIAVLITRSGNLNSIWDFHNGHKSLEWLKERLATYDISFDDVEWARKERETNDPGQQ